MISKHISNKESVYSRTAQRLDIDNTPTKDHKENMVELAENIFEPLRAYVGGPMMTILTGCMLAMYLKTKTETDA